MRCFMACPAFFFFAFPHFCFASPDHVDAYGDTPLSDALREEKDQTVRLLLEYGARLSSVKVVLFWLVLDQC
jgi:ankyrin repeat protein